MSASDENETLVRWGLHLLEVHPFTGSNDSRSSSPDSLPCCCPVDGTEDDEALAISLQQHLYTEDTTQPQQQPREEDPPIGDFFDNRDKEHHNLNDYGLVTGSEEICEDCAAEEMSMGNHHSSSSSSSPTFSYDQRNNSTNENDEAIAVILSEELAQLDGGEVGRRLTHMESIPHIPKINGEIPSPDAATLDHQRLLERLQVYGLTEHKIPGDGNCQFRALSDQFYRTPDHHMFVRKEVIKQLKQDPEPYEGYVPMKFSDYLKKMAKNGEWGDHVTLQAAADVYGMKICLITSFIDTCIIDIIPKEPKSDRVIFLSFWAEVHYNSVYPEGEAPVSYTVRKKRHWFSFFG
ncbi:uncharacterized protein LOC9631842 [Selaginella moellendorffii]|nr:uncharacterized protein LOC9631842 [Selaginella moellendorffii]|eukprot:XP_002966964.2 uncharacterized protein LOC9631842 [Selaginella moellendorffii]